MQPGKCKKLANASSITKCFGLEALHKWDEDKRRSSMIADVTDATW